MRDNLEEKYVIEKGKETSGEIASPFPIQGNLCYPCIGQFHQIIGTRIFGSKKCRIVLAFKNSDKTNCKITEYSLEICVITLPAIGVNAGC